MDLGIPRLLTLPFNIEKHASLDKGGGAVSGPQEGEAFVCFAMFV